MAAIDHCNLAFDLGHAQALKWQRLIGTPVQKTTVTLRGLCAILTCRLGASGRCLKGIATLLSSES